MTEGLLGQEATRLQAVVVHGVMTLELKQAIQLHRYFPRKHPEHLSLHRRSIACEINTACDVASPCCPLVLELHPLSSFQANEHFLGHGADLLSYINTYFKKPGCRGCGVFSGRVLAWQSQGLEFHLQHGEKYISGRNVHIINA